jgi:dihydrolipoamide dehydrogenase
VLEHRDHLLGRLEPFAGELVAAQLREDGVDLRLGVSAEHVHRDGSTGPVTVRLSDGVELTGDELLVAAGRRPATTDLGLEVVDLEPGASVPVDDSLLVPGVPWLYAAGDVNGRVLLTHQGKYQGRVAGDAIVARSRGEESAYLAEADHTMVPQVIFTDPEVASVGLTEAQAVTRGLRVRVVTHDMGAVAGASLHADGYTGRAAIVVDEDRGVLVGATFVGQDVADLVHSATIAVVGEVPVERLRHAVPSYPTISEIWLRLLEGYGL